MTTSTDGSEDCKYVRRIGGKKQVDMGRERMGDIAMVLHGFLDSILSVFETYFISFN